MICASCGAENRSGRKLCGECGSALAFACPSCGAANEPTVKLCGECGTGLSQAPADAPTARAAAATSGPLAERRLVSALFADFVGFTTLSESRDAEEVRELLSRYFETSRAVIARYGGVVEKFIGDAVMAVWGTPTTMEDDAERAVRAPLELVDAVEALGEEVGAPKLAARAGVLTGEAAVNLEATGEGMVDLSMPFHTAVALLEHSEWLVRHRRTDDATDLLREAGEIFERLKAASWLERLAKVRGDRVTAAPS